MKGDSKNILSGGGWRVQTAVREWGDDPCTLLSSVLPEGGGGESLETFSNVLFHRGFPSSGTDMTNVHLHHVTFSNKEDIIT